MALDKFSKDSPPCGLKHCRISYHIKLKNVCSGDTCGDSESDTSGVNSTGIGWMIVRILSNI